MMENKYLLKIAELEIGEHQQRVLDKFEAQGEGKGLIVAHGMGSGKTTTGLLVAKKVHEKNPDHHVVAITPASLTRNFDEQNEEHKLGVNKKRFSTYSYDKAANNLEEIVKLHPKVLIVDEAHKLRNTDTARYKAVKEILDRTGAKPLFLTGTPDYNHPSDMRVLLNLSAKETIVPHATKDFNDTFIGTRKVKPGFLGKMMGATDGEIKYVKNTDELRTHMTKYMDIYDGKTQKSEDFPSSHEEDVKVTMSKKQHDMYRFLENDLPAPIRWKVRLGLPLDKKESGQLNSFSAGVRQVSNSTVPYSKSDVGHNSPKIDQIVKDHLAAKEGDPNFRGIIYSNYLEAGLRPLSKELSKAGVNHAVYDGSLSAKEKDALIEEYNQGKTPTLLLSSTGTEGLNLKGTKIVQTMEPHFNQKKIDQVVARGIRFKSHAHLPDEERHVSVKHYHSVLPKGMWSEITGSHTNSIDEYLKKMSKDKVEIGDQIKSLVSTDPGHYKSAELRNLLIKVAHDWQNPPPMHAVVMDKITNPAKYVGAVQSSIIKGNKGQILSKIEKILISKPFKGEGDFLGQRS